MADKPSSEKINLIDLKNFHDLVNNAIAVNEKRVMANVANATSKERVEEVEATAIQITHKAIGTKKHDIDTTDQVVDKEELAKFKKKVIIAKPVAIKDKAAEPEPVATTTNPAPKVAKATKKVIINGQTFDNAVQAATHFNIHPTTVRTRCSDSKYADWNYEMIEE